MRYEGRIFRPPSEAHSYIVQATVGCSHNHCTYCDMYRDKSFRVRDLDAARSLFPRLRRVSCYAMARNVLAKSDAELARLRAGGLTRFYLGPESGDDVTLKRIAKGGTFADHVEAARRAHAAGVETSVIALLGAGGVERSAVHAEKTAELVTAMDPAYFAALTLTVTPDTPQAKLQATGRFVLPDVAGLLGELRMIVAGARPTDAVFRTNHASNHLPIGGRLPRDREAIVAAIDGALAGRIPLRPESARGL
jgi:radical SAM superfamily enzyme YgiQ (UPF0313 family)